MGYWPALAAQAANASVIEASKKKRLKRDIDPPESGGTISADRPDGNGNLALANIIRSYYIPPMDPVRELVNQRPWGDEVLCAASAPEALEVAPGIYMSPGTSNAYMVLTAGGRVIVNTGLGFEALTHKRNFDAVSTLPTTHILVTQGHVDHVGGVGLFREPGTRFIAQANNGRCQADDARIAARRQTHSYVWFQEVIDYALEVASKHPDVVVQDAPVPGRAVHGHCSRWRPATCASSC
jgi:hypothetical protein